MKKIGETSRWLWQLLSLSSILKMKKTAIITIGYDLFDRSGAGLKKV
jgi:hypothetical protein